MMGGSKVPIAQLREGEGSPRHPDAVGKDKGGSPMSSTNVMETLPGTRMHQGEPGSLCATPTMASETFRRSTQGLSGWRWRGCVCTAATSPQTILSRSSGLRFSFLREDLSRLVGEPSLRVTSIASRASGGKLA